MIEAVVEKEPAQLGEDRADAVGTEIDMLRGLVSRMIQHEMPEHLAELVVADFAGAIEPLSSSLRFCDFCGRHRLEFRTLTKG